MSELTGLRVFRPPVKGGYNPMVIIKDGIRYVEEPPEADKKIYTQWLNEHYGVGQWKYMTRYCHHLHPACGRGDPKTKMNCRHCDGKCTRPGREVVYFNAKN